MSDAEKQKVTEIATTKQLNLLDDTLSAASPLEGTPSEQLMEVLEVVDSPENFATAIAGHAIDVVQDCIFMLDSQPRRRLLESWLELLQSGE
jgi:hypothetical protein